MEQEQLSTLMDGELEPDHAESLLRGMRDDPAATAIWAQYHLIGDALRGEPSLAPAMSARLAAALAAEPTILAPGRSQRSRDIRRFALPIAASVAGVAVVGWLTLSAHNESSTFAQLPPQTELVAAAGDEVVRELMRFHQEFSPSTAMPGVASYIRTVGVSERAMAR